MKSAIKTTCSQCPEKNKACKEMRCPLWAYHNSGNPTPLWQKSRGKIPSKDNCIATTCYMCKRNGNIKQGIENCESTHCPLWSKRKYSLSAIRKAQEIMDARRCLGLDPVNESSSIMQLLYKINGIEMHPTDEPIEPDSSAKLPLIKEKKERRKKHSPAEREVIRKSHASVRELSNIYDCSPTTIQKIKAGG